jgi:REP element-mobilizing transposase RayT
MTLYRRNLPHIEKPGGTYFVTFRTIDNLTLSPEAKSVILNHCLFDNGRKIQLHAVVVMPNHVHLLFTPLQKTADEWFSLAEIMNGIKGASSHSVNRLLQRRGTLWLDESFDRVMRSADELGEKILYIVENPIAAGLAKGPHDYPWCWRESTQPGAAVPHSRR